MPAMMLSVERRPAVATNGVPITGVPAVTNPFDPDQIRVDGAFVSPAGQTSSVPAFWYQGYQRRLSGGSEALSAVGAAEWRLRFTPPASR